MSGYYIGIDGGGTKTEAVVFAEQSEKARAVSGAINYNSVPAQVILENMKSILNEFEKMGYSPKECLGVGIGTAGISNPETEGFLKSCLRQCGYTCKSIVVGDQISAFYGALEKGSGVLLIAGTGSICYGRSSDGKNVRCGGYGHIIDDKGSAYDLACGILRAVVYAHDGRGPQTALTELVFEALNITDVSGLVGFLYAAQNGKREIAALARLIDDGKLKKDAAAMLLKAQCVEDWMSLIAPVIKEVGEDTRLAVSGSLILKSRELYESFLKWVKRRYPGVTVCPAKYDAACGAAMMAREADVPKT